MSCDLNYKRILLFYKGDSESSFISHKFSSYHSEITCEKPFRKKKGKVEKKTSLSTTVLQYISPAPAVIEAQWHLQQSLGPFFRNFMSFMAFNFADVTGYL